MNADIFQDTCLIWVSLAALVQALPLHREVEKAVSCQDLASLLKSPQNLFKVQDLDALTS